MILFFVSCVHPDNATVPMTIVSTKTIENIFLFVFHNRPHPCIPEVMVGVLFKYCSN